MPRTPFHPKPARAKQRPALTHAPPTAGHLGQTTDAYQAPCPADYGFPEPNATATYCSAPNNCPQLGDFNDPWFPANSSRWIVDLGIAHAAAALAANRSFYVNLHFHISHAPLLPTDAQLAAAGLLDANKSCAWSGMVPLPAFFGGRCPMQTFRASQHAADAEIGRLLDWLIAQNIEGDTIIFLTAGAGARIRLSGPLLPSACSPLPPSPPAQTTGQRPRRSTLTRWAPRASSGGASAACTRAASACPLCGAGPM